MKINLLEINNFKSIVNIKIEDVSSFSVFAGANGCRKSNLFEALEFVRDVVRYGGMEAIKKHNGYENIHSHKLRETNAKKFFALKLIQRYSDTTLISKIN